jgi:zinc transporter ZupT
MNDFISGLLTAISATISLFFLKFFRESRDRLFAFFAAGFALLGFYWATPVLFTVHSETRHYWFLIRLGGFVLIIAGVIEKNRARR